MTSPIPAGPADTTQHPPELDHHGGARARGLRAVTRSSNTTGKFGWLFRGLPAMSLSDTERDAMLAVLVEPVDGATGGWGGTPTTQDNPAIPAIYTYLSQMLDHDITFDPTADGDRRQDPDELQNYRTPRLDLDNLYGSGPKVSPHLYDRTQSGKLLTSVDGADLPRNQQGTALIGDPRNDVHVIVSQLHHAFIRFHNAVLDLVIADPSLVPGAASPLEAAQQLVRWHWQWLVLHDLLPKIVGQATMDLVLTRTTPARGLPKEITHLKLYTPKRAPYLPVEFSGALFRFGHSMVRHSYQLNDTVGPIPTFSASPTPGELEDLRGHRALPSGWQLQFTHFAPTPGGNPTPSRLLDSHLAPDLLTLPADVDALRRSLALLNLNRGLQLELPSGESFAAAVQATGVELAGPTLQPGQTGFPATPLWLWMLKEAELLNGGTHLGPVAGRVIAEVVVGLVVKDPSSYLRVAPSWTPGQQLPVAQTDTFTITDLLTIAGRL